MDNVLILLRINALPLRQKRRCIELLRSAYHRDGGISDVLKELSAGLPSAAAEVRDVRRALERAERSGLTVLPLGTSAYPPELWHLSVPPLVLFVRTRSDKELLPAASRSVSMVGARKGDSEGVALTKKLAIFLRHRLLTIVSGLAYGIDSASHWAALSVVNEAVPTIAVLPCGGDVIYPRGHERLAQQILDNGGALVSEYLPGTPAKKHHFLERNRIVAALSSCVVIVQAALRSGALSTATHGAEIGRDVFVFPGPFQAPLYQGNHRLIRSGAQLLSTFDDILECSSLEDFSRGEDSSSNPVSRAPEACAVLEILKQQPVIHFTQIAEQLSTNFSIKTGESDFSLSRLLLELEMEGVVRSHAGGQYSVA
ncbi:DNA-processing protein DprA [bacterium]|nr:DNA-processing protein DprA [bacterium]